MRQRHNIDIRYEDEYLIVCVKPAGMPVQTAKTGQQDMVSWLKNYRARKKEEPYIGVVHRLDQPVSGIMVFAKNQEAASDLSRQVRMRQIDKEYRAIICGVPENPPGQWNEMRDWLLRDGKTNTSRVVSKDTAGAKEARLEYCIEEVDEEKERCRVHIKLHTGRHHQIRVQFAQAGYPLVGDTKYGNNSVPERHHSVELCSCKIGFIHPVSKEKMEFFYMK